MRLNQRASEELRPVQITRHYTKHAEGSVLVAFGDTRVLCTASVSPGVPKFLKGTNEGWLTAEYGMLPRATHSRTDREAAKGKQSGRTLEIQRLIGRALRCAVDLKLLGENTLQVDCDVLQADGGTRTAAITGACVAVYDAIDFLRKRELVAGNPFKGFIAAVSVGLYQNTPILDLDYGEDSQAETDMNVVMTEDGKFIEVQGTAEGAPFHEESLHELLKLAAQGIEKLITLQKQAVAS